MSELALHGGKPVRTDPWPHWPQIGQEEKDAAMRVLNRTDVECPLNMFRASEGDWFLGGPEVRAFEKLLADYHDVEYAISFTSATAALHAAIVACDIGPGDQVIVTPYSFHPSATCPLMNNAVPVFADVSPNTFCLDPKAIEDAITPKTKAIIPVHLFGGAANMDGIMEIANEYSLFVIEDCAQSPGGRYKGRGLGTIGDCGVFSFVAQKNASSGEGGMLITDDPEIVRLARLVRNHGDALREPMLGYNYRMTELTAAIGAEQWKKLDGNNYCRLRLATHLTRHIVGLLGLTVPLLCDKHALYVYPLLFDEREARFSREFFVEALAAEGIPFGAGYIQPLYQYPLFQQRAHYALQEWAKDISYDYGLCPVTEWLSKEALVLTMVCRPPSTERDMEQVAEAIRKVMILGREAQAT